MTIHRYTCEKCGKEFESPTIRKDRHIHCYDCRKKYPHTKDDKCLVSIKSVSKRTISKILKRASAGCAICGWKESTCDIHHIVPKSEGGTDSDTNLVIVCPNCHRIIHTSDKYDVEYLQNISIDKMLNDWRKYYHPSN